MNCFIFGCIDDNANSDRQFIVPVEATMVALLKNEDIDRDIQITVDDRGPKVAYRYS